jgi:peptide-methionine (S)-S-oxide reductase
MKKLFLKTMSLLPVAALICGIAHADVPKLPDPAVDTEITSAAPKSETIVLAGGCFWGIQAVFQHLKGVSTAVSGYAGGAADTAKYGDVSTGTTGHAESVQVTYDPSQISLGKILKVYFSVAHDPTELNHQGPDTGTQYRSEIFYTTPDQRKIATAYIAQLQKAKVFSAPIVTKVEPLKGFYPAEDYHQNYATLHPDDAYIAINDAPKVENLKKNFPEWYVGK